MTNLPNFEPYGYQIIEQLNQNNQSGRITYKAIDLKLQKFVVIKQFNFVNKKWDGYKEIEREITVLQSLNHSGIPKYLTQFDSNDGLCLVQEYKQAQPLSKYNVSNLELKEIKSIATQLLEILVYLQERIPPIFHRDIKPENILIDEVMKIYLIDFGLARIGNDTIALSSMMGGTLGFMSPEQVYNQKLTKASDLYGLGVTLICLITETKSSEIGNLVNFSDNKIAFREQVKVSWLNFKFINWLEQMIQPNPNNRYQNAKQALTALDSFTNLFNTKLFNSNLSQFKLAIKTMPILVGLIVGIFVTKLEVTFLDDQINPILSGLVFGMGAGLFTYGFLQEPIEYLIESQWLKLATPFYKKGLNNRAVALYIFTIILIGVLIGLGLITGVSGKT